ncbi:YiiG family protein [Paenibacillus durus]|uniref:YiiG family protein n=1 Tax=Paenibacillus durus TaxID=44251 RepID=UPI00069497E1|nr:YiiG family protein [Paenibacillus durus]
MQILNKSGLLAGILVFLLMVTACSALQTEKAAETKSEAADTGTKTNGATASAGAKEAGSDESEKLADTDKLNLEMEKYNAYVDLNNFMTSRMQDVLNDYFEEFGDGNKPKIEKYFSGSLLSISEYDKDTMNRAFDYKDKEPAFDAVDTAIVQLEPAIKKLAAVLGEAYDYYDVKGYVDDQFAKGKQLHTQIITAYKAYEKAADVYFDAINDLGNKRTQAELKELRKNDEQIRYSILTFMLDAEALSDVMEQQEIYADNILKLDLKPFKEKYNVLITDLQNINKYAADKARIKTEGFREYALENYVDAAKEVKVAATNIIERVNNKEAVDEFTLNSSFFRKNKEGTPENYNDKLSILIDKYNQLNQ